MTEVIQQGNKECTGLGMDTVAILCLAIVPKAQYDAAMVKEIQPVLVNGNNNEVIAKIPPVMFVGPASQVQETMIHRIMGEFQKYEDIRNKKG